MSSIEQTLQLSCDEGEIPNAVAVASDRTGQFQYAKAFGVRSLVSNEPIQLEATMWMASCTKLLTTIATMQCVERGLLNLDDDVSLILPELNHLPILEGFDEENGGKPILVPNSKNATLRQLLTHTSGLSYDALSPSLTRYQEYLKKEAPANTPGGKLIRDKFVFPLLFAPGEGWEYGVGIDWAGQMVERVSNMSLEEYFRINIWQPLHIEDMTFRPHTNALVQKNFTEMSVRQGGVSRYGTPADPAGKLEAASSQTYWSATSDSDDCHGGSGLYGSMPSYHKILQTFLSSPSRLLRGSSIDAMFTPQLNAVSQAALVRVLSIPEVNTAYGSVGPVADPDCGLGGILNRRALDSGRPACSLTWCGYPGLVWWVDRTAGVVGIWGAQLAPPGDERLAVLQREWEREIYERVRGTGEGKRDEEEESDAKGKL